jgi:hypothetical protein
MLKTGFREYLLELIPRSELLLKDPQRFVAAREAEQRVARSAGTGN